MSLVTVNGNLQILESATEQDLSVGIRRYREAWGNNPSTNTVGSFPLHLDLESTSVCNLKCSFCATTYNAYDQGFLDLDLCRAILDEGAGEGLQSVKFNVRGEPLLHRQLPDMVAYAKSKGLVDVFFNTNGTGLTERIVYRLIGAGLDRIIISFEGYEKKFYEGYRVGATFDRVVRNVRRLRAIRDACGFGKPLIRVQTVGVPGLDLHRYREFWGPYADEITCVDMRSELSMPSPESAPWACPNLWQRLTVTWDGWILLCPYMNRDLRHYVFKGYGRFPSIRIREAWLGEKAAEFRRLHLGGRAHEVDPCAKCTHRASEVSKLKRMAGASD